MYKFTVDPNYCGKNLPGWFLVSSYLQKKLGEKIKFIPCKDFDECRNTVISGEVDIVYANPLDWVIYMNKLNFIPLAKPIDHYDEVLVCSTKYKNYTQLIKPINITSAHKKTFVHMMGLFLLEKSEIDLDNCNFSFCGSYQNVIKDLLQTNFDLGFVFNEVYEKSSKIIKDQLNILDASNDGLIFHAFCISPKLASYQNEILDAIENFDKRLLADIGFKGFEPVNEDEIFTISNLANEYIENLD